MKILKFYSPTCGPCKVLESQLKELGIEYTNINISDSNKGDIISKYSIRAVPTLLVVDSELKEIRRHVGLFKQGELEEFIKV